MANVVGWLEIPCSDIERAAKFYGSLFNGEMKIEADGKRRTAMLPGTQPDGVGASLTQIDGFEPGANGPLAYLDAGEDLTPMLARVEPSGGTILMPRTDMGNDFGFFATFRDTEGNTLALYSPK